MCAARMQVRFGFSTRHGGQMSSARRDCLGRLHEKVALTEHLLFSEAPLGVASTAPACASRAPSPTVRPPRPRKPDIRTGGGGNRHDGQRGVVLCELALRGQASYSCHCLGDCPIEMAYAPLGAPDPVDVVRAGSGRMIPQTWQREGVRRLGVAQGGIKVTPWPLRAGCQKTLGGRDVSTGGPLVHVRRGMEGVIGAGQGQAPVQCS